MAAPRSDRLPVPAGARSVRRSPARPTLAQRLAACRDPLDVAVDRLLADLADLGELVRPLARATVEVKLPPPARPDRPVVTPRLVRSADDAPSPRSPLVLAPVTSRRRARIQAAPRQVA